MKCPSEYRLRPAGESDAEGLRALYEHVRFSGNLSVQFLRGDSPYHSLQLDGESAAVAVVERSNGCIIAAGACVTRRVYFGGEVCTAGYLTGLKFLPGNRKAAALIPQGFSVLFEQCPQADVFYSTVLADGAQARRLLERPRESMPRFLPRGRYTVYCMAAGIGRPTITLERGPSAEWERFVRGRLRKYDFSPADFNLPGLRERDFYCMRENGRIAATCVVWNQQAHKQYRMGPYGGPYRLLAGLPTRLVGYPKLPAAGSDLNYATMALFCCREGLGENRIRAFVKSVAACATEYELLLCGLHESDGRTAALHDLRHVAYRSDLYRVFPAGAAPAKQAGREIYIDVGSL